MKSILGSLLGVIVVFTGAVWLVDSVQNVDSYYETYQKLKETELISRGWVARVIPTSSYDIHETRGLDGKIVAVNFRFRPGDTPDIDSRCTVVLHDDQMIRRYRCPKTADGVVLNLESSGHGQVLTK